MTTEIEILISHYSDGEETSIRATNTATGEVIEEISTDEDFTSAAIVLGHPGGRDVFRIRQAEEGLQVLHEVSTGRLSVTLDGARTRVRGPVTLVDALSCWPPNAVELREHLADIADSLEGEALLEVYEFALRRLRGGTPPAAARPLPSQVDTGTASAAPFIACFGRFEAEMCAALYVEACRDRGDRWQPIGPEAVILKLLELGRTKAAPTWVAFTLMTGKSMDVHTLIRDGFFRKADDGREYFTVEPTDKFFETIQRKGYVRQAVAA